MGAIYRNGVQYGAGTGNVRGNWSQSDMTAEDYILNKPTLGTASAVDTTTSITSGGTGVPTSGAVYSAIQEIGGTVDSELSTSSTNPVQNKVITNALEDKVDSSSVGAANGVASLDSSGLVPAAQLPFFKVSAVLTAGSTSVSFTNANFGGTTMLLGMASTIAGMSYTSISQSGTTITMTFDAQSSNATIYAVFCNF